MTVGNEHHLFFLNDGLSSLFTIDAYWLNLTPLRAFFARVICQFYATNATKLDEFLPVATSLAHYIKDAWFNLLSHDDEEVTEDQTFILDQLLQLAQMLDFTDEAGRRAMMDGFVGSLFTVTTYYFVRLIGMHTDDERPNGVRNMLTDQAFPESLYGGAFDLLAKLVENDTDFMQIIVELVQDLRFEANVTAPEPQPDDSDEDSDLDVEESLKTPARRQVAPQRLEPTTLDVEHAALHIRCLLYIRNLLERVIAPIKENPMLRGLVHEVIVPAVRTKDEDIRKLGMHDLGLCCLLDRVRLMKPCCPRCTADMHELHRKWRLKALDSMPISRLKNPSLPRCASTFFASYLTSYSSTAPISSRRKATMCATLS